MASPGFLGEIYEERQHQAAYIFDPLGELGNTARPAKRRKPSKRSTQAGHEVHGAKNADFFRRLLRGSESQQAMKLRQEAFEKAWSVIDTRIQSILRDTNRSTLQQVTSFLQNAPHHTPAGKIPSAFIVTGPNIASQDLLFERLAETLQREACAQVVRLRSSDAPNLRAILRKTIHDIVSKGSINGDELDLTTNRDGRKFLNYDLEALYSHLKLLPRHGPVIIAFQDSEAFDSGLLSDFISLLRSWLDRIPFAFLFGVATSVELFETRLLKSTCQSLYGDKFDVEQTASIVDKIFNTAVAHCEASILLGPNLIGSLLERQRDQVASIPDFIRSLKYAYMCHFYANPLSFLVLDVKANAILPSHVETVRYLPSFRRAVEAAVKKSNLSLASQLLEDDGKLIKYLLDCLQKRRQWAVKLLRILKIFTAGKTLTVDFANLFMDASYNGVGASDWYSQFFNSIKRMEPSDSEGYLGQLLNVIRHGDQNLGLNPWMDEAPETVALCSEILASIKQLRRAADSQGHALRNTNSGQSKVLRTTIVAQKVQLSQDTATVTNHDKSYTDLVRRLLEHLEGTTRIDGARDMPFNEVWLYDSKMPYRDVFIPRPRNVLERALSRPHDYLGCTCCKADEAQITSSLPTTAIIYQLYLETGSLINAADLWSAFYAILSEDSQDSQEAPDERTALVLFYRSLAEMRAMGFVKQSRKKADHMAKLAWKGF